MVNDPALRRFPVPEGIPSAVTLPELALLQHFAHDAGTVLEIGTHYGFTCIGMALAGAHVTSVDPHNQGPEGASTWEPFLANVKRHRCGCQWFIGGTPIDEGWFGGLARHGTVEAWRCAIEDWEGISAESEFRAGLVFIDGDHVAPAPWRDAEIAMAHLAPGGWIAFHDVTPRWPDVWQAALQLNAKGWREVGREGTLRVYQRP